MYKWIEKDMGELNRARAPSPSCCVLYYVVFCVRWLCRPYTQSRESEGHRNYLNTWLWHA